MKQTITIDIEVRDGYELKYNPETRTINEVKIEPIRSKSWEEFCKNHPNVSENEYQIDTRGYVEKYGIRGCKRHSAHKHLLATEEDAEGILALIQLTRLHDEWIEGSDYKRFRDKAYIYRAILNDRYDVCVGSPHHLLDFPTPDMAREFLNCFKDLIEKAKKFI